MREAAEIEASFHVQEDHIKELFTTFRRPLLLGIMLAGLQQVSGITPLFSCLPEIFRAAGTITSDAFLQSVLEGIINLLFTFVALGLIDNAGAAACQSRPQCGGLWLFSAISYFQSCRNTWDPTECSGALVVIFTHCSRRAQLLPEWRICRGGDSCKQWVINSLRNHDVVEAKIPYVPFQRDKHPYLAYYCGLMLAHEALRRTPILHPEGQSLAASLRSTGAFSAAISNLRLQIMPFTFPSRPRRP